MKNPKQFYQNLHILIEAYKNGMLKSGDCAACAVGNILAAANGWKVCKTADGNGWLDPKTNTELRTGNILYDHARTVRSNTQSVPVSNVWYYYPDSYTAKEQIEPSNYTMDQLMSIERAFECRDSGEIEMAFAPLSKRLDSAIIALGKVHEMTDDEIDEVLCECVPAMKLKVANENGCTSQEG